MSSPLPPSGSNGQTPETDKRATTTRHHPQQEEMQAAASLTMEEGVDIVHAATYVDYNAYSFDVAHANSVVDTGNPLEQVHVAVGTKRPLEEAATDPMSLIPTTTTTTAAAKRYKTNEETTRRINNNNNTTAAAAAAATNKQWDAMFERLVAFKQRNGVRDDGYGELAILRGRTSKAHFHICFLFYCKNSIVLYPNDTQKTPN